MELRKLTKRGAIELSVGTVVIIVLAMSMLILGIVLIRNIFSGATTSITQIDQGVKNEINQLFSQNQDRKLILFPTTGIVEIEQGSQDSGFAISIRNTADSADKDFSFEVESDSEGSCSEDPLASGGPVRIITGQEGSIKLPPNTAMENPIHIRFGVDDTAPTCTFRVKVSVTESATPGSGPAYGTPDFMDIEIVPK